MCLSAEPQSVSQLATADEQGAMVLEGTVAEQVIQALSADHLTLASTENQTDGKCFKNIAEVA